MTPSVDKSSPARHTHAAALSRRRFIRFAGASLAGPIVAACGRGIVLEDLSDAELARLEDPRLAATLVAEATRAAAGVATGRPAPTSTSGPPLVARALGFDTDIALTPGPDFYVMKYGTIPDVDAGAWRLEIGGLVERPVTLGMADVRALPTATVLRTLECISNPAGGGLIGNAVWRGVRLADVLALAGPRAPGRELKLEGADRYHTGVPLDLALDPRSMLVWEMNGAPLRREHGFPVRCLFPGRYGQKQPKWLTRITVQAERHAGHWEAQGWSDTAEIRINSRIDRPADRATARGPVTFSGIAFSGLSGVARVELVVNDRAVHPAGLRRAPDPFGELVWTEWAWTWDDPPPGNHVILARAEDGAGRRQSRARAHVLEGTFPDGTSDMHRVRVAVPSS